MWTALTINNRIIHILHTGNQGPVFIWPFFPHKGDELDHMEGLLNDMLPGFGITVIACEVTDWNLELSPWKGVSIDGSMLGGGGCRFPELDTKQSVSPDRRTGHRFTEMLYDGILSCRVICHVESV